MCVDRQTDRQTDGQYLGTDLFTCFHHHASWRVKQHCQAVLQLSYVSSKTVFLLLASHKSAPLQHFVCPDQTNAHEQHSQRSHRCKLNALLFETHSFHQHKIHGGDCLERYIREENKVEENGVARTII